MPSEEEQSVRAVIERMIGDWDAAYTEGNAYGMVGHGVPEATAVENNRRKWASVMDWTEERTAHSTIRELCLGEGRATVVVERHSQFCFRRPLPTYLPLGRAFLGFCARFVFTDREVSRSTWVNTRVGWLGYDWQRLSYRCRVRMRTRLNNTIGQSE